MKRETCSIEGDNQRDDNLCTAVCQVIPSPSKKNLCIYNKRVHVSSLDMLWYHTSCGIFCRNGRGIGSDQAGVAVELANA